MNYFRILMTFMLQTDNMNLTEEQNTNLFIQPMKICMISEILQKGIDSGEFSPDIDIRQMQNAIWGMFNGIISLYIFTGSPDKTCERIHSTVQR